MTKTYTLEVTKDEVWRLAESFYLTAGGDPEDMIERSLAMKFLEILAPLEEDHESDVEKFKRELEGL